MSSSSGILKFGRDRPNRRSNSAQFATSKKSAIIVDASAAKRNKSIIFSASWSPAASSPAGFARFGDSPEPPDADDRAGDPGLAGRGGGRRSAMASGEIVHWSWSDMTASNCWRLRWRCLAA
jgi:hypothetical protein